MVEESQGNPEIGMTADSFEEAEAQTDSGSSEFFDQLENEVNSGIIDDTEVTQSQTSGSEQVTHVQQDAGSENVTQSSNDSTDWKKDTKIVVEKLSAYQNSIKVSNLLYLF